jgi:signal transduction histidine kinase
MPQPGILMLGVDDFTRPYMPILFEAFAGAVSAGPDAPALYFEPLDASRFEEQRYLEELRRWLRGKYEGKRIDLVVTLGEDALDFLSRASGEPWPWAQVMYLESGSVRADPRGRLRTVGGMLLEDHVPAALGVLKTMLPDTRHVAMVYGASAVERARWRLFADTVRRAGLEPIDLAGVSLEQTSAALARLPAHSVAVVLAPIVDGNGRVVSPIHVCELVASGRTVPIVALETHYLGCGAVGGLMRDWEVIGRLLGEEALARLRRPSSEVVTVPVGRHTTLAFDDRQLLGWGIPGRRLFADAAFEFEEPDLWRDHRAIVLAVVGVTLVQSLLVAGLVFEHRRRRRAELDSRRNLAALAHLDRRAAMGELATSLAHELNQPLNAILQNAGVAQMLLTSHGVPQALAEIPDIVSDIRKDDIRASEVIRRMRGLLQKHELESHPVDLNEVALETLAIVRPDARSREIDLETDLADGLAPIAGDRIHLQQVLLNLLMNAVHAVAAEPPGQRRVRVSTSQVNGDVRLAVADTGPGIPVNRLSEIFEPFFTTKGGGGGMGMGLAIARSIVEAHSGRMAAENNAGGGATVWFSVPVSPVARM